MAVAAVTGIALVGLSCSGDDDADEDATDRTTTSEQTSSTTTTTQPQASGDGQQAAFTIVENLAVEAIDLADELVQDPSSASEADLERLREIYTEDSPTPPSVQERLDELTSNGQKVRAGPSGIFDEFMVHGMVAQGEVARGTEFVPAEGGRFDLRLPGFVWRDEVLFHLGALLRAYHDAAATFPWAGRESCYEAREPAETICHNGVFPSNTVFRDGLPVALIDCDTAAPGPRVWELGWTAWRWVPFFRDEKCRAIGLPIGVADKARRFRVLLDAYGIERDLTIVHAGIERSRQFLEHQVQFAARGSEWEVELARRGFFDEAAAEIAWVEENAVALVES